MLHNGEVIRENYPPALYRLEVGTRVGISRCHDGTMHVYINGQDLGVAASHIPRVSVCVKGLFYEFVTLF